MTKEQITLDLTLNRAVEFTIKNGMPEQPKTIDFSTLTSTEKQLLDDVVLMLRAKTKPVLQKVESE